MGRSYKRNDPYSSHRAKSLREKRKQSKTKYRRENVNNSTEFVENYQQPRKALRPQGLPTPRITQLSPNYMTKVTTIQTIPPVNVKLWTHGSKHFWAYDYPGNSKNGPFKSEKLALLDATQFSSDS